MSKTETYPVLGQANDGTGPAIRTVPNRRCSLCLREGRLLYSELSDRLYGVPGTWGIRQCGNPDCGLMWLDPVPVPDDIPLLYARYYTHLVDRAPPWLIRTYNAVSSAIVTSAFGYRDALPANRATLALGRLLSCIRDVRDRFGGDIMWLPQSWRGRLLDLGCGEGRFLERMQALGWKVAGIEPDTEAIQAAKKRGPFDVYEGTLEEVDLPPNSFDVVTMNHVFEHLSYPLEALAKVHRILRPAGRLVLTTPNTQGYGHRHFGPHWAGLDPPRHFYLYNQNCLRQAVVKAGFRVIEDRTVSRGAAYHLIVSHLLKKGRRQEQCADCPSLLRQARRKVFRMGFYQVCQTWALGFDPGLGESLLLMGQKA